MGRLVKNVITKNNIKKVFDLTYSDLEQYKNKTFYITGATGIVGNFIIRYLLTANKKENLNLKVIASVRNIQKAKLYYARELFVHNRYLKIHKADLTQKINYSGKIDYIINTASFINDNVLDFAKKKNVKSIVHVTKIGTANYLSNNDIPLKICALAPLISSNMPYEDDSLFAQKARDIVEKKSHDIIIDQNEEYCFIIDAVIAIFKILLKGENSQTYNISNKDYPNNAKDLGYAPQISLRNAYSYLISSFYYQLDIEEIFVPSTEVYKHFVEKIFSVRNKDGYKIITLFGKNINLDNKLIYQIRNYFYSKQKIKQNKIVFTVFNGMSYFDNPKYIAEEILKRNLDCELVWLINDAKNENKYTEIPKSIRRVECFNKKAIKELFTAKLWIDNNRKILHLQRGLKKRQGQIYINTWHGSFGIKKCGTSRDNFYMGYNKETNDVVLEERDMCDYFITDSKFDEEILWPNMFPNSVQKKFGHPRNDIFFKSDEEKRVIIDKIYEKYNISKDKKILFYAPTFRDNKILDCYTIDTKRLLDFLGEDWVIFVRFHSQIQKQAPRIFYFNDRLINVSLYPDIQELMLAANIMISDYSSCIFDFLLTGKPGFIFATDIENYNNERGLFYPLETTPFSIARNNNELIENIKNFNADEYKLKTENFLKEKGNMEDGQASKRVVDFIQELINNG